jgi:hypothetical protein
VNTLVTDQVPIAERCAYFLSALTNAENYDILLQRLQKNYNTKPMNLLIDPTLPQDITNYYDPITSTCYVQANCTVEIVLEGFHQHLISEGFKKELSSQDFAKTLIEKAKAYTKMSGLKAEKPKLTQTRNNQRQCEGLEVIVNGQRII